ncbi:alpha/beta hydrolase [Streptomyces triticagri]|uniref:Alpha/beta hydrolase n=1 Tax=Streptomyces triticagri TaxID=2293568 RepID=A0A372M3S9_9ACTN|nr:alpha/beta hydrolase [Streptomyces triticagri]RFU85594.1 alpha/beta hydrolase [Streptomyces triticagri]
MTAPTIHSLRVDGATLHHEVRGSGPLLLLIPGGAGDSASYDGIADDLATEYTVATYDPRGLSRSPLDDPAAEQTVARHAEDAYALLQSLAPGERARVFGASSGAITALELLSSRPECIERLVAHEPPVVEVLPDAADHRALIARVQETLRAEGLMPAMAVFAAGLTEQPADDSGDPAQEPDLELPPEAAARAERTMANLPYFVGRIVPAFMSYAPDIRRLDELSDRLVLAAGRESRGELPHRPAAFLADRLGTELLHFPGGHTGLTTHPAEYAELLHKALASGRA